jgi:pyruvate dehydrogenase E1 component
MPEFWQFPTVSMGLGPLMAIYQARFLKYLHARGIADTANRKVWVFCGDGEMDEPESAGRHRPGGAREARQPDLRRQLQPAAPGRPGARQRQDHPGARRRVPRLGLERDQAAVGQQLGPAAGARQGRRLRKIMMDTLDGDYQAFKANDGAFVRKHFFGRDPRTLEMVAKMSDDDIWNLRRGGHDPQKVYAAFHPPTTTRASRPCCWSRPSRATAWARPARARTPRTRPRS